MIKTRIRGKVETGECGRYYWWCECLIDGAEKKIHIDSRKGEAPKWYTKKTKALDDLAKAGREVRKALIEATGGPSKVMMMDNVGGIKI